MKSVLQFPLEDFSNNYGARIKFTLKKPPSTNAKAILNDMIVASNNKALSAFGGSGGDVEGAIVVTPSKDTQFKRRADNTIEGADGARSCLLYLPSGIQISDGVDISNVDLGAIGGAALSGIQNSGELIDGIKAAGSNVGDAVGSLFRRDLLNDPAASAAAVALLNRAAPAGGTIASMASGVAANPNTKAYFKGVKLRSFAFNFKLIPSSAGEAKEIKNIIKFFRSELYPEKIASTDNADYSVGYYFPNLFQISFLYENEKEIATKLLPAYLQNFSATYNGGQSAFHRGGEFSEVDISLSFTETETLDRARVEGYSTDSKDGLFYGGGY